MDTSENLSSYFEYDSTVERLEVECGPNKAHLFVDKLCQGSKGKCIEFNVSVWAVITNLLDFQYYCFAMPSPGTPPTTK